MQATILRSFHFATNHGCETNICLIRSFTGIIFVMSSCAYGVWHFQNGHSCLRHNESFFNPIVMKLHRNDTWEVHMFNKYLLNYEFQNIEYQVSNGFSLAELVWEIFSEKITWTLIDYRKDLSIVKKGNNKMWNITSEYS
jgi:hypothetical protein